MPKRKPILKPLPGNDPFTKGMNWSAETVAQGAKALENAIKKSRVKRGRDPITGVKNSPHGSYVDSRKKKHGVTE